jgi:predicted NBD/HSP70 family sugar kinase
MENKSTADQALVRELNLSLVLWQIHNEGSVSRAQLAVGTGLNKSTVSSLVEELIGLRLIHETGLNSAGTGRPATLLEIDPQAGYIIGVELGVDFVSIGLTDFAGKILWRRMAGADPAEEQEIVLAKTTELVGKAINEARKRKMGLLGLGLAIPGIVDIKEGVLVFAPNLDWRNIPLRKIFSEKTGLRVFIENDANAAAVAEHLFGLARRCADFVFVFDGVGIGGGLFLNGQLYRGKNGFAGEIGHSPILPITQQGFFDGKNLNKWETYANQPSIIQRVESRLEGKRSGIIPNLMAEQNAPLSISIIQQAADCGDVVAIDSISETGLALGQGVAAIINFLNPEKIILGGPMSAAGSHLLPSIKESIAKYSLPEMSRQAELVVSEFGEDASLIGAVAIVVNDVMSHPTQMERR